MIYRGEIVLALPWSLRVILTSVGLLYCQKSKREELEGDFVWTAVNCTYEQAIIGSYLYLLYLCFTIGLWGRLKPAVMLTVLLIHAVIVSSKYMLSVCVCDIAVHWYRHFTR